MPRSCSATRTGVVAASSPDRPGLRGRGNLRRPARGAGRHRARAHRSRDAGAESAGHRLDLWSDEPGFADSVQATGVTGICGSGIIEAIAEMYPRRHHLRGRRHRRRAGGALAAHHRQRPHLLLCAEGRRAEDHHHPDRRARHPARQGGALCRHQAADGQAAYGPCRPHPVRRRLRLLHRSEIRHGARA